MSEHARLQPLFHRRRRLSRLARQAWTRRLRVLQPWTSSPLHTPTSSLLRCEGLLLHLLAQSVHGTNMVTGIDGVLRPWHLQLAAMISFIYVGFDDIVMPRFSVLMDCRCSWRSRPHFRTPSSCHLPPPYRKLSMVPRRSARASSPPRLLHLSCRCHLARLCLLDYLLTFLSLLLVLVGDHPCASYPAKTESLPCHSLRIRVCRCAFCALPITSVLVASSSA